MSDTQTTKPQVPPFAPPKDAEEKTPEPKAALEIANEIDTEIGAGGIVTLPCGYLDPETKNLYNQVRIREMNGFDEDELVNPANARGSKAFDTLLARCMTEIVGLYQKPDPQRYDPKMEQLGQRLRIGDRYYLLINLRRLSLGDEYPVTMLCSNPRCNKQGQYDVDLSEVRKILMPNPKEDIIDVEMPSGLKATVRQLTARDESALNQLREEHKHDFLSASLRLRVMRLNGKELIGATALQQLSLRDRNALRDAIEECDGGVDTEIKFDCPKCGAQFSADLPLDQPTFFFPSGTRKR